MEKIVNQTFYLTSQKTDFPIIDHQNEITLMKVVQNMVHIFVNYKLKVI